MSIFWDRKEYNAFKYRIGCKETLRDKICHRGYSTPGWVMHAEIIGDRRAENLFRRYVSKGNLANRMYWRSHPLEWQKVRDLVNRNRSNKS